MLGSGESHTAYFYKRSNAQAQIEPSMKKIILPGRTQLNEEDIEVVCDPLFLEPIRLAVGPHEKFKSHVNATMSKVFNADRPRRERKAKS